jgi:hypothetical protein
MLGGALNIAGMPTANTLLFVSSSGHISPLGLGPNLSIGAGPMLNVTTGGGGGGNGLLTVVSKTTNYSMAAGDTAKVFDNTGAAGEVDFTLPAYSNGLNFCFTVTAAQVVKIIAGASTKITIGATNSGSAGNITASTVFSSVCIYAGSISNQWVTSSDTGTWVVN